MLTKDFRKLQDNVTSRSNFWCVLCNQITASTCVNQTTDKINKIHHKKQTNKQMNKQSNK